MCYETLMLVGINECIADLSLIVKIKLLTTIAFVVIDTVQNLRLNCRAADNRCEAGSRDGAVESHSAFSGPRVWHRLDTLAAALARSWGSTPQ